jgi:hypothetical protein
LIRLKNFLFLFFFKRVYKKFSKRIIKNPLIFYQNFPFKVVKALVRLKVYKLYNKKYKKKKFDIKLIIKLIFFLKCLKNPKLNLFTDFLSSYIKYIINKISKQGLKPRP